MKYRNNECTRSWDQAAGSARDPGRPSGVPPRNIIGKVPWFWEVILWRCRFVIVISLSNNCTRSQSQHHWFDIHRKELRRPLVGRMLPKAQICAVSLDQHQSACTEWTSQCLVGQFRLVTYCTFQCDVLQKVNEGSISLEFIARRDLIGLSQPTSNCMTW